uniref:Plasmodium vivax Vir protein n=1 Tax=Parastrongyloides trichosuri TaxID=131310 RepID=A0A0N4ZUU6_PARTI
MGSVLYDIFNKSINNEKYLPGTININSRNTNSSMENVQKNEQYNEIKATNMERDDMIYLFATLAAFLGACCLLLTFTNHYLAKKILRLRRERNVMARNELEDGQVFTTNNSKSLYNNKYKESTLETVD